MNKKKKRKLKKGKLALIILAIVVLIILLLIGCVVGYALYARNQVGNSNILLIGVDVGESDSVYYRADSLMLINFNADESKVSMISIPRDTYTYVPCEEDYDKINHSYAFGQATNWCDGEFGGGVECTIDSVEKLFDIKEIDSFVQVDFEKIILLVDEFGGVEITPTSTFTEHYNGEYFNFTQGESVVMNGKMALTYARHRYTDTDTARASRQQEVLLAMMSKIKSLNILEQIDLGKQILGQLTTNISEIEMLGYLTYLPNLTIEQTVLDGEDWYHPETGIYYYKPLDDSLNRIKNIIKQD